MPRKQRSSVPGAYYHIIIRGNNRARIFFSSEDRKYFLSLLEEGVKRYQYTIHSYCLMSNHVHIALQVGSTSISKIMHNINSRYARWINKHQKRIGHVFQARFKSIFIDSKSYLLELVRYIHLNPVRAKMVEFPERYKWSSHQIYLGRKNTLLVATDTVFNILDVNRPAAIRKYKELMHNATLPEVEKILLGDNEVLDDHFTYPVTRKHNLSNVCDLNEIINFVCSHYSISEMELKNTSRNRLHSLARGTIAWLAKELKIINTTVCANHFNRDASGLIRLINRLQSCEESLNLLNDLKSRLINRIYP